MEDVIVRVADIMTTPVRCATPSDSLSRAAGRMLRNGIGSLVVLDGGELIGIITERDLARAVADRRDPEFTPVVSYMTPNPVTIEQDDDTGGVATMMLGLGLRHLPVMSAGCVVGTVSARDLLILEIWPAGDPGDLVHVAPAA